MAYQARYTFELDDYRALLAAAALRQRFGRWTNLIYLAAYLVVLFAVIEVVLPVVMGRGWKWPDTTSLAIDIGVIAGVLLIFQVLYQRRWWQRLFYRRLAVADKPVTLELFDDGVRADLPGVSSRLDWSALQACVGGTDHFVLMLSRIEGFMVPARGFENRAMYEVALARERVKER